MAFTKSSFKESVKEYASTQVPEGPHIDPKFDAHLDSDGIYRSRWGCRFCGIEGCGLVSDWKGAEGERCVFHIGCADDEAMTELLHKYRPLVILAKVFERVHDEPDKIRGDVVYPGRKVRKGLFDFFRELVQQSRFNCVPHLQDDGEISEIVAPLPIPKDQLKKGQRFVRPIEYLHAVLLSHVDFVVASKRAKAKDAGEPKRTVNEWRADKLREKIASLGATWSRYSPPPKPQASANFDDDVPW